MKILILIGLIGILLLAGCSNYNNDWICEDMCGGKFIKQTKILTTEIYCTSGHMNNLSSYQRYDLTVICVYTGE